MENIYDPEDLPVAEITYKYNENGNKIEANLYSSDAVLYSKETFKYEYDKIGNWINKISFNNNEPIKITERVIEYY